MWRLGYSIPRVVRKEESGSLVTSEMTLIHAKSIKGSHEIDKGEPLGPAVSAELWERA
jgi:hypothetical protein